MRGDTYRRVRHEAIPVVFFIASLLTCRAAGQAPHTTGIDHPPPVKIAVLDVPRVLKSDREFLQDMAEVRRAIEAHTKWVTEEQQRIPQLCAKLEALEPGTPEYEVIVRELEIWDSHYRANVPPPGSPRENPGEREAAAYFDAYTKLQRAVADYAVENGIQLVLRYTRGSTNPEDVEDIIQRINRSVIHSEDVLDITGAVIERMNRDR